MRFISTIFVILFSLSLYSQQENIDVTSDHQDGISTVKYSFSGPTETILGFWYPANTYPDLPAATYFQCSVWIGDTLYVQAPTSAGAAATTILKYTLGSMGFVQGVPMPAAKVGGAMVKCAGKLYYFGGGATMTTSLTADVYEYNPATGVWTQKAPMPTAMTGHGAVCWGDSVIFIVGGPYASSATNLNVHYYRPATNTWGTITNSLPSGQGRRTFALGLWGNKIVVAGGYNTAFLKNTLIGTIGGNASEITWVTGPVIPTVWTGLSRPGGTAFENKFFFVCGEKGGPGGYYDTTHVMDLTNNTWVGVLDNIPMKMSNICNAVAPRLVNDSIYLFIPGGYGSATGLTPGAGHQKFNVGKLTEGVIPVELTAFNYCIISNGIELLWTTATETNNYGFEIEKSVDGNSFTKIGFVEGHGSTTIENKYSFIDETKNSKMYYRLKQLDFNGESEYSSVLSVELMPSKYSLSQNFPNPFNPSTVIEFSIPEDNMVNLSVFDILGNEITTLVSENRKAGYHSVSFDASNISAGVYLYKLSVGKFNEVKKMLLVK